VEAKFRRLAAAWRADTAYLSSTNDQVAHPAFLKIGEQKLSVTFFDFAALKRFLTPFLPR
jgi:hypothetical protein